MRNWMDLNGDGEIDSSEMMFAGEMLCTSREEHEALFGDAGDFEDDAKDDLYEKRFIWTWIGSSVCNGMCCACDWFNRCGK